MTTPRRPPGRYDEPRTLSRPVRLALVGVGVLGLLVALFLAWQRFESKDRTYTFLGFTVLGDTSVQVRFQVPLTPGTTTRCELRAHDAQGVQVGDETVTVGPVQSATALVAHVLTTSRRAATAEVVGCSP